MADPLLGRTIAHYEIVSRLGGGGMGVVYKAHDRKLGRHVALKFLPQQWSHDEGAKQRFLREAQAASATHHPNICTVHDIDTADDGQLFIVMGFYEGPTLKQRLEDGPLPVDEALDIATQIADGLAKAHGQGVVHRDIKPGNVILTEDGVRIVDFGLATFVDALQLTAQGSTLGTAAYMSPEQARGEEADARSDVWAVGIVLYEMLTGRVPFRGAYAEAITYAIRHDPPPPIRAIRAEVPEDVEQLVFRALHKDHAVRYATCRELARALRQVRGFTVPQELRTMPIDVPAGASLRPDAARRRPRPALYVAAALATVLFIGAPAWIFLPGERVRVAVAPVSNLTGDAQLNSYRLALTQRLITELADSADLQVLPYDQLLPLIRRFLEPGGNVSSRDALQVIAANAGADIVIAPVIDYRDDQFLARAEFRSPAAGPTPVEDAATEPRRSALVQEAASQLVPSLATVIEDRFKSRRTRIREWLRGRFGFEAAAPSVVATLEAARSFEEGIRGYDAGEFAAARTAFAASADLDRQNPLPVAWQARVATLMRQDEESADAAARALKLMSEQTRPDERLFIEAVAAESQRDFTQAEERYGELVSANPDEAKWILELGAYRDRRGENKEAIATYLEALRSNDGLTRARVELCRLYNRVNEPANARTQGEQALERYRALGDRSGEVQTLFCLTETLRTGDGNERRQGAAHAKDALSAVQSLGYRYNEARAYNYLALAAEADGNLAEAVSAWEQAGERARSTSNVSLEALVLMNLGVSYEALGRATQALERYRQSFALYQKLRNEARAAEIQANLGMLSIEYGIDPDQGQQQLRNALGIFRQLGNRSFEVFGAYMIAEYHRYGGHLVEAEREATRALDLARERDLDSEVAATLIGLAQVRMTQGNMADAERLLGEALAHGSGRDRDHARLRLAEWHLRVGDVARAAVEVEAVGRELDGRSDGLLSLLHRVRGDLAVATGRDNDARRHYADAALLWTDDLPDEASVEARGGLGLMDARRGRAGGSADIDACIQQARKMRRLLLEVKCRLYLTETQLASGDAEAATRTLAEVPGDSAERALGPELRAQVHFWHGRTLMRNDPAAARSEFGRARDAITDVRTRLPERYREGFAARVDVRPLLAAASEP